MAYIARTNGKREPIDTPVSLEKAREIINVGEHGIVERVCPRATPGVVFLCDEEGLLKNLPYNEHGHRLYGKGNSPIVGDIIVFETRREAKGWL